MTMTKIRHVMEVGENMRRIEFIRRSQGLSQRQFGERVGVDASYICNAERNGVMYDGHLRRIADSLGIQDRASLLEEVRIAEAVV